MTWISHESHLPLTFDTVNNNQAVRVNS